MRNEKSEYIIPSVFDQRVAEAVAKDVEEAASKPASPAATGEREGV
jgi:malic enzyme